MWVTEWVSGEVWRPDSVINFRPRKFCSNRASIRPLHDVLKFLNIVCLLFVLEISKQYSMKLHSFHCCCRAVHGHKRMWKLPASVVPQRAVVPQTCRGAVGNWLQNRWWFHVTHILVLDFAVCWKFIGPKREIGGCSVWAFVCLAVGSLQTKPRKAKLCVFRLKKKKLEEEEKITNSLLHVGVTFKYLYAFHWLTQQAL